MTPLGSIFKSGAIKPPKIDQHSLFTSIQVSVPILEGKLQVYEPWRRKRNRPKECHVTLYANETSPFVVWSKVDKVKPPGSGAASSSGSESPTSTFSKIRCVLSVSRAKMCKTTGGSFEVTDFASSLTFRFIADSVREANRWVEKLAEESLREANLDMRSICSSCSSFSSSTSSFSSHTSPDSVDGAARCFSVSSVDASERKIFHKKSASFSDTNGAMIHLLSTGGSLP
uniref:PH domain-containing protein n=1 Tax=Ciona savignyi TaxID=51511 RepID=H2Z5V6_CIOSA